MADRTVVEKIKQFVAAAIDAGYPVVGAVLFGSFARGDQRDWSDIDVIALMRDDVPESDLWRLGNELNLLAVKYDSRIELLTVHESRFAQDDNSQYIHLARQEGIHIAA